MTEGRTTMRSRAPWIEALRACLARAFAAACLLFPLAAALPAAAQEGGKGGASSVERAMYERGLELAALGRAQPRDADHYRGEMHYAASRPKEAGSVFRDCAECPEMVVVPAGSFRMGSPSSEEGRDRDEGPRRRVTISEPFAVGKYEVTSSEWDACLSAGGCRGYRPDGFRGNHPVVNVNWKDARRYVLWLSERTGKSYYLLSESEWEYAARAGTTTRYSWGNSVGRNRANCDGCRSRWGGLQTAPVGSFGANGFGLHDMHGNVWEWVEDCWNDSYEGAPSDGSVWHSGDCSRRVLRGGSWSYLPWSLRSAYRSWNDTGNRDDYYGFRVARTLAP